MMQPYAKAITAAVIAGLTALGVAVIPDAVAGVGSEVNATEWVTIALAFFVALGAVWGIPNKDPDGTHQGESVQPSHPIVLPPTTPETHPTL